MSGVVDEQEDFGGMTVLLTSMVGPAMVASHGSLERGIDARPIPHHGSEISYALTRDHGRVHFVGAPLLSACRRRQRPTSAPAS